MSWAEAHAADWSTIPGCAASQSHRVGRKLANNARNFWQFATDNDLVVAPHFADPQVGRSSPECVRLTVIRIV